MGSVDLFSFSILLPSQTSSTIPRLSFNQAGHPGFIIKITKKSKS